MQHYSSQVLSHFIFNFCLVMCNKYMAQWLGMHWTRAPQIAQHNNKACNKLPPNRNKFWSVVFAAIVRCSLWRFFSLHVCIRLSCASTWAAKLRLWTNCCSHVSNPFSQIFSFFWVNCGDKGVFHFVFASQPNAHGIREKKKKCNAFTNKLHTFAVATLFAPPASGARKKKREPKTSNTHTSKKLFPFRMNDCKESKQ